VHRTFNNRRVRSYCPNHFSKDFRPPGTFVFRESSSWLCKAGQSTRFDFDEAAVAFQIAQGADLGELIIGRRSHTPSSMLRTPVTFPFITYPPGGRRLKHSAMRSQASFV
jgi:hypothetical protein